VACFVRLGVEIYSLQNGTDIKVSVPFVTLYKRETEGLAVNLG
jgi:hypothetical protein